MGTLRAIRRAMALAAAVALFLGAAQPARAFHSVDTTQDGIVSLAELVRAIQFYNSDGYHCAAGTEDGYAPGPGETDCLYHNSDYNPADWHVDLPELLRSIQLYNARGYTEATGTEDGFSLGAPLVVQPTEALQRFDALSGDQDDVLTPTEARDELPTPQAFDAVDANGDGVISRFEFLHYNHGQLPGISGDTGGPIMTLIGPDTVELHCGEQFVDPGATAFDPDEGDISRYVKRVDSFSSTRTPGTYTVTYSVLDAACNHFETTRTVIVTDGAPPTINVSGGIKTIQCGSNYSDYFVYYNDDCIGNVAHTSTAGQIDTHQLGDQYINYTATDLAGNTTTAQRQINVVDTTRPTISLNGDSYQLVPLNTAWTDPGAQVTDLCDGALAYSVQGTVDTAVAGQYPITYSATDSHGNAAHPATRTVQVYDLDGPAVALQITFNHASFAASLSPRPVAKTGNIYYYPQGTSVQVTLSCWGGGEGEGEGEGGGEGEGEGEGEGYGYYGELIGASAYLNNVYHDYFYCGQTNTYSLLADAQLRFEPEFYYCDYCCYYKGLGISCEGEGEYEGYYGEGEGEGEGEGSVEGATEGQIDGSFENPFRFVADYPRSNFSIDVDTASYSLMRRYIKKYGYLPAPTEVRIEEYLNYFDYPYPRPTKDAIFNIYNDLIPCPWQPGNQLLRVALQSPSFQTDKRPDANLVLLVDISSSMGGPDRLDLIKASLRQVVRDVFGPNDKITIVAYATGYRLVIGFTNCTDANKPLILNAIDNLQPGGSTNGSGSLLYAYSCARGGFIQNGVNRVILASDGDFNVGITDEQELINLIKDEAASGVTLTTLGFGIGNYNDSLMEALADNGNGNYYYVDTLKEATKILVQESRSTFEVIARDVKIRVEFDPSQVLQYRLIGYENRGLSDQEFEDDNVDAGELGLGDSVTALYEIVPTPNKIGLPEVMAIVDVRYKRLDCERSLLVTSTVSNVVQNSPDAQFAAAIAEYGLLLRNSKYKGNASYPAAISLAQQGLGTDPYGYRNEFVQVMQEASATK